MRLLVRVLAVVALVLAAAGPVLAAPARALARMADRAELDLPPSSRTPPEPGELVPVVGPWRVAGTVDGVRTWEAPLPVRPRTLFFHRPPDDLALFRVRDGGAVPLRRPVDGRALSFDRKLSAWGREGTWAFTARTVLVRRRAEEGPPRPGEYAVRYTRAVERERALNLESSGLEPRAFAFRSLQLDDATRTGLLLPAPARARWAGVEVPEGAVLEMEPVLLPPEAADPDGASDGAVLVVRADGRELWRGRLEPGAPPRRVRVPLDPVAGGVADVELATEPGGDARLDYVFVGEPTIFVPSDDPPRAVIVFVDTLRRDHLPTYGYERPTMPALDRWAREATVFDEARSVAPWTLPSTRALLTGRQPEDWGRARTLQVAFAEAGWYTAFLAGNVYLSSNFDMADGWSLHRCVNWPRAEVQVDRALGLLRRERDRPVFLVLHFMDAHLPYIEPLRYRRLFAGARPAAFSSDEFHRSQVIAAARRGGEAVRRYVRDRYDDNLRYVDDELARFLAALDGDDAVVFLADHGEEFWDHGGFEHGHTLWDELLRVPLVARLPGLAPGRVDAPVSLLDVAPTLARAFGVDLGRVAGRPLQEAAGDGAAAFEARPQAFGRPLYGSRRWGVLAGGDKALFAEGRSEVFDLRADPGEHDGRPPRDAARWRALMARALGRPVELGFRLATTRSRARAPLVAELVVPGGVRAAWVGDDPTRASEAEVEVEGELVRARWTAASRGAREIFVVPERPAEEVAPDLRLRVVLGRREVEAEPPEDVREEPTDDGSGRTLVRAVLGGRPVSVDYATVPLPASGDRALVGFDEEVRAELQALGYVSP